MPSLQVRELPDNIYYSLQKKAQAEHRSLAQEAVIVLAKGLNTSVSNKNRRKELLQSIADNHFENQAVMQFDPVELIREDRLDASAAIEIVLQRESAKQMQQY